MSHLPINQNHWFTNSPFTLDVTIVGTSSTVLSSLEWRVAEKASVTSGITAADNSDGDAVVSVPVTASDMRNLSAGIHRWQLQASVSSSGPRVIGLGDLTLDALADTP